MPCPALVSGSASAIGSRGDQHSLLARQFQIMSELTPGEIKTKTPRIPRISQIQ
jgi:hypothetical protein